MDGCAGDFEIIHALAFVAGALEVGTEQLGDEGRVGWGCPFGKIVTQCQSIYAGIALLGCSPNKENQRPDRRHQADRPQHGDAGIPFLAVFSG